MRTSMKPRRAFVVASCGGHLEQALRLLECLEGYEVTIITERNETTETLEAGDRLLFLPHGGRERPLRFALKFAWNCLLSAVRLLRYRPRVVISTGAHTGVPSCVFGRLLGTHVVYIESFARVSTRNLSGRIIHPFAHLFLVQWEEATKLYPKAEYWGKIY